METKHGICGICPAGCWVTVGVENGKLVSIAADERHPLGMLCTRGEHAPDIVHSPHRLQYPMKRTGPKGTYAFERISWDEAYDIIVSRLTAIKAESGPEAVSIYTGRGAFELSLCDIYQPQEAAVSSASSILFPFGSPNTMGVGALCYVSFAMIAPHVTMGRMLINLFADIENAALLIIWGANPITDSPPLDMHRLEQAKQRGADIIAIDPRHSETAKRLGAEWVPIRPGTDGALALGILNVMIDEELYDEGFVTAWTRGFGELAQYVQHFRPAVVEEITQVPAETVRRLARRICAAAGAAPIMYTGLEYSNSGIQAIRAVFTVWALAGQLDVPGGLCFAMDGSQFPINRGNLLQNPDLRKAVARDVFPLYSQYRGESHATGLVNAVLKHDPYPIRALIIDGGSLLTSWPQTPVWRETLSHLDFLVSIDRQLTADMAYADIVLPATTMFEIESYMTYGPLFRIRERLIEPVGEARSDYLIMAELARRLGYGDRYPQSEDAALRHVLKGSGFSPEDVRNNGGTATVDAPLMEYRKWEKGALRRDGKPGFDTPSGKFEIASSILEDYGYEPLPKYTEPREGPRAAPDLAKTYPLVFNSGTRLQTDFRSQHHGIESLVRGNPAPVVELHTADAQARGIMTGDLVEVRTVRGAVGFRARVTDDIIRGAVEANMGGGTPVGPKAWQDSNVNELTDLSNYDAISGFPVYKALLCDVVKIAEGDETTKLQATKEAPARMDADEQQHVRRIYLDNNATTRTDDAVRDAMLPFLSEQYGNPSSIHAHGREAHEAIEAARRSVAKLIHAAPRRIIFTGGGSEADNLALKGIAFALREKGTHIITSAVEHPAVLKACAFLETAGFTVTYLPVDDAGTVQPAALEQACTDHTILVSIMTANNETGTIQPIAALAAIAHAHGAVFHTDAVQAAGKIALDVAATDVDALTLSAHKFHGPKGVGALYIKKDIPLEPLIHGGSQEARRRAGTENVAGIVGMGAAAERAVHGLADMVAVGRLRDRLEAGIRERIPDARTNGDSGCRLPNTLNMTLPGLRGESIVIALDQKGIALSSGSACKAGSPEPSHALLAMGLSDADAHCAVRFSLSHETADDDIDATLSALDDVLREMRETVRFLPCK